MSDGLADVRGWGGWRFTNDGVWVTMATLSGGGGNDSITGDPNFPNEADSLSGLGGNDTLVGLGGNDTLLGGDGDDSLIGGTGADVLNGGAGTDTASYVTAGGSVVVNLVTGGTVGDASGDSYVSIENVIGSNSNDTLTGNTGNNVLSGGGGNDSLVGGDGNDTLIGGVGADRLIGGAGIDTASYETAGAAVTASLGGGTLTGDAAGDFYSSIENLTGSNFNDSLTGNNSDNVLSGGAGNDTLSAGGGDDTLIGGLGADSLIGGGGIDVASYETALAGVTANLLNSALNTGEAAGDTYNTIEDLTGSSFNDLLVGDNNANILAGGDGNDTLVGGGGNDTLQGGLGIDTADYSSNTGAGVLASLVSNTVTSTGSSGNDALVSIENITGSNFNDTITGDTGSGVFSGLGGNDSIIFGAGDDTVFGGDGNDTIDDLAGGNLTGVNLLDGGAGNDVIWGGFGNDTIIGGDGVDTLWGEGDDDSILGDAGNDILYGGDGNDNLDGGSGVDTLLGDAGNDTLRGGAGADSLSGGVGNDTFIIGAGDADNGLTAETISGGGGGIGAPGDFDVLDLQGYGWGRVDIVYDPLNGENGTVTFFAPDGVTVVGTLNFTEIESVIPCFTAGTLIETDRGPIAVETLREGDLVLTRDSGLQPVRWVGRRNLSAAELLAQPDLRPVRIEAKALDGFPLRDMLLSAQHRVLVENARAELLFGDAEVLVAAKHLVGAKGVSRVLPTAGVTYVHVLFDRHEIILSEGLWSESFQPAQRMVSGMEAPVRDEVLAIFPELATSGGAFEAARPTLKTHEARVLLSA